MVKKTPNKQKQFIKVIKDKMIDIKTDGSVWLNQDFFNYATGLKMIKTSKWESLLGVKRRKPESNIEQIHCNLAIAIQIITEEIVIKLAHETKRVTGAKNLCLAGELPLTVWQMVNL